VYRTGVRLEPGKDYRGAGRVLCFER
jgi:hypothetical protein